MRPASGWFARLHRPVRARLRAHARRLYRHARRVLLTRRLIVPVAAVAMLALGGTLFTVSSAATSSRSSTAARSSCMSAPRPRTRIEKTEAIFQAIEDKIREVIPAQRSRAHPRQYRPAGAHLQSRLHRRHRRSASTTASILVALKEGHAPTAGYHQEAAPRRCRQAFPERAVLFPARRHGDADPQFRHSRRRSTCARSGYDRANNQAGRQGAAAAHGGNAGHRRCAYAAGARCAGTLSRRSTARAPRSSG